MLDVGVHSAVADQPQQVKRAAIVNRALDRPVQRRVRRKLTAGHSKVDAGQPLIDDEAGADIGVTDLEFPICPAGSPTASPEVSRVACG